MTQAVVCDNCQRVATDPSPYYSIDEWDEDGFAHSVDICPNCIPDVVVVLLEDEDDGEPAGTTCTPANLGMDEVDR